VIIWVGDVISTSLLVLTPSPKWGMYLQDTHMQKTIVIISYSENSPNKLNYCYFYHTSFIRLNLRLSFFNFECMRWCKWLNFSPAQFHPNNCAAVACFVASIVWKLVINVGLCSLSGTPNWGFLNLFYFLYKCFKSSFSKFLAYLVNLTPFTEWRMSLN